MGKCCIASAIAAHKEIIKDGVSGFLFDCDSKEAFYGKVRQAITSPRDYLCALGEAGKRSVNSVFNWDRTTALFETIYRQALES